jgi:ribosomal protein S18 acetylase RimI-like enzyme
LNHPLDNVIWSALTTRHAALAQGDALARRYAPDYARFAAMELPTAAGFEALARLLKGGEETALCTVSDVDLSAEFEVIFRRDMIQMVGPRVDKLTISNSITTLGAGDAADMLALVQQTKPGPFYARTRELGRYAGIRVQAKLVAMAGERMHLDGYTEISAVCTDPAFRGHGYARDLIVSMAKGIVSREEVPFLHVFADNLSAIALYEHLGFHKRAALRLTAIRKMPT